MNEPLWDGMSAAAVVFGVIAVVVLRIARGSPNPSSSTKTLSLVGYVALVLCLAVFLIRWAQGISALADDQRPSFVRSAALLMSCAAGVGVAISLLASRDQRAQRNHFAFLSGLVATACFFAVWQWAVLVLVLIVPGVWFATNSKREQSRTHLPQQNSNQSDVPALADALGSTRQTPEGVQINEGHATATKEPVLVGVLTALLLLLLLGTWDHVFEREIQRETRSPRYSAWPRATALHDAWQRTGWTVKPEDKGSVKFVESTASREQHIAWGLGALMLVIAVAARGVSKSESDVPPTDLHQEPPHVG